MGVAMADERYGREASAEDELRRVEEVQRATGRAARRAAGRYMLAAGIWIAVTSFGLTALGSLSVPWAWRLVATMALVAVTLWVWRRSEHFGDVHDRPPRRALVVASLLSLIAMIAVWAVIGVQGLVAAGVFSAVALATFLIAAWWVSRA
jgi:hypothetical protein